MNKTLHALPDLPYSYDALKPYIDEETMKIHHDKHHAAYVNNLNAALEKYENLHQKSAKELILDLESVPEEIRTVVKNNAGGHINHTMFWEIVTSPAEALAKAGPSGKLLKEIEGTFGSFAEFQDKFNEAGTKRFGSGWVWLVKTQDGALQIMSTANQDNPMADGHMPILGNDVWEHAYYLKYKNARPDYLKAWWNVVNWQEVEKRMSN